MEKLICEELKAIALNVHVLMGVPTHYSTCAVHAVIFTLLTFAFILEVMRGGGERREGGNQ